MIVIIYVHMSGRTFFSLHEWFSKKYLHQDDIAIVRAVKSTLTKNRHKFETSSSENPRLSGWNRDLKFQKFFLQQFFRSVHVFWLEEKRPVSQWKYSVGYVEKSIKKKKKNSKRMKMRIRKNLFHLAHPLVTFPFITNTCKACAAFCYRFYLCVYILFLIPYFKVGARVLKGR